MVYRKDDARLCCYSDLTPLKHERCASATACQLFLKQRLLQLKVYLNSTPYNAHLKCVACTRPAALPAAINSCASASTHTSCRSTMSSLQCDR